MSSRKSRSELCSGTDGVSLCAARLAGVRSGGVSSKRRVARSKRGRLSEPPLLGVCACGARLAAWALWGLAETWQNWRSVRAGHSWTSMRLHPMRRNRRRGLPVALAIACVAAFTGAVPRQPAAEISQRAENSAAPVNAGLRNCRQWRLSRTSR